MPDGLQPNHKCPICGGQLYTYGEGIWCCHDCDYSSVQMSLPGILKVIKYKEEKSGFLDRIQEAPKFMED